MSFDRKEYRDFVEEQQKKQVADLVPQLRAIRAAAIIADELKTGNAAWDRYLAYLQPLLEQAQGQRQATLNKLARADGWELLSALKSDLIKFDAMIMVFNLAMGLPKAILKDGNQADELIKEYERAYPNAITG